MYKPSIYNIKKDGSLIIRDIGSRGKIFTFEAEQFPAAGEVWVYLIDTGRRFFLCVQSYILHNISAIIGTARRI